MFYHILSILSLWWLWWDCFGSIFWCRIIGVFRLSWGWISRASGSHAAFNVSNSQAAAGQHWHGIGRMSERKVLASHFFFFGGGVLFSEVLSRVPNIFQDTHIEISSGANLEQKHGSKSSCFRSVVQLARSFKIQTRGSRSRHGAEKSGHYAL